MLNKQAEKFGNGDLEDRMDQLDGEEIESNEDENEVNNNANAAEELNNQLEELYRLREEDDILGCQVEALKNELIELHAIHDEDMQHRNRLLSDLLSIKRNLDNSKRALLSLCQKRLKEKGEADSNTLPEMKKRRKNSYEQASKEDLNEVTASLDKGASSSTSSSTVNPEKEARLIGLISVYLNVLPFGANVDYICSYLHQIDSTVKPQEVESLLKRYPSIFKQKSVGTDGNLSGNWIFATFQK